MGKHARKTPYKKLLKEEKAKTKLKISHKTILPKGQNITNTTFKVKKIVVKSQLREREGEILSKSNLNIKDLLSRLHHHNAPLRVSSLSGLCEIVDSQGNSILNTYLSVLLHAASNLVLDKDQEVRSEASKLLSSILTKATDEQLSELFEIIVKHLSCAMSHINTGIRSNSLSVLDILISKRPNLTAKHCQSVVLPAFLDLISTKYADSERKLMVQYSDNMTTNMWRIKVLARLHALLSAVIGIRKEENSIQGEREYVKRIKWEDGKPMDVYLYSSSFDGNETVDLFRIQSEKGKTQFDQTNIIKNYAELLMPLLLDIFVEVAPRKTKNQKCAQLSNEAAVLQKLIADVILLLWQIFESSDPSNYLKIWFSAEFSNPIFERVIAGRFPYNLLENNRIGSLKDKRCKTVIVSDISPEHSKFLVDQRCTYLNVTLSHICLLLRKYSCSPREFKSLLQYITNVLPSCLQLDRETTIQILNCADSLFSLDWGREKLKFDTAQLVRVLKQLYHDSLAKNDAHHNFVTEKTFSYLYKIVSSEKNNAANDKDLNSWLDSLPSLLTEKKISFNMVKCIANISRCNIPTFSNSLDGYIESILNNLPHLEIISDRKSDRVEGKKLIINLLYFAQTWDDEFISELNKALSSGYFGHLNSYVKDIMECKLSLN